jgi:thiamine transport system substrate-binding protein
VTIGARAPRGLLLGVLLAFLVALVGCGDDDSTGASAATSGGPTSRGGGRVVLMTHDSFAVSDDVLAAFEDESGYRVDVLRSGDAGSVVNQAILTADDPVADVLYGIDDTFLTRALDAGIFEPFEASGLDAVPDEYRLDPEHRVTPVDYADVCLNYDKTFFGADPPPPDSLADLAEPEYAGLTVVEDASLSSPGLAFLLATIDRYGDDWPKYWQSLVDNNVLVAPDWESAYYTHFTVGGGGDRPIVVSYASSPPADVVFADPPKDEPAIGVVDDGCYRQVELAGVLAGAANPDGARALVDFMLTRRFQEDMPLNMFVFPARRDAELPPVFVEHALVPERPLRMDPEEIGANRDEWIEQWSDLVS